MPATKKTATIYSVSPSGKADELDVKQVAQVAIHNS
jgi:hypothetical protein